MAIGALVQVGREFGRRRIANIPSFGFLASMVLLVLLFPTWILLWHLWGLDHVSYGEYVRLPSPPMDYQSARPTEKPLVVRIDSQHRWYLNEKQVTRDQLKSELRAALSRRADRYVYFQADQAIDCGTAFDAIGTIRGVLGAEVVLITPKAMLGL